MVRAAFLDAHAQNETAEDQYPNHNIPYGPGDRLLVVVGDSISTSHYRPHAANGEYPFLLANAMRIGLINLAVAGWETDAMIAHAVPLIPRDSNVVIYEGGINDLIFTGTRALQRIDRVISVIHSQAPRAKIVIVGLRDFRDSLSASIRAWNTREKLVARSTGAAYVDLYSTFPPSDRAEWPDGVHPNAKGAEHLAQIIRRTLSPN